MMTTADHVALANRLGARVTVRARPASQGPGVGAEPLVDVDRFRETFAKAMVLGAANCLKKPFELEDIFRSVGELIGSDEGEGSKNTAAPDPADGAGPWHRN